MSQDRLRLASLTVLGGSLHGRRYEPEEVVAEILIGSDPDCHLVVDLPGISPIHARVWADLDDTRVHDTHAPRGVFVNTERVEGEAPLRANDVLWLGPLGDPHSVCVQPRFEPWVERLPPPAAGEQATAEEATVGEVEAQAVAPVPDEDAVFVAEGDDAVVAESDEPLVVAAEEPLPAEAEPASEPGGDAPEEGEALLVEPAVAEVSTAAVADDWAIAEPTPEVPTSAPPAAGVPEQGPTAEPGAAADEFFVEDGSMASEGAEGGGLLLEPPADDRAAADLPPAGPAFDLPPLVPTQVPKPDLAVPAQAKPIPPAIVLPLPPAPVAAPPPPTASAPPPAVVPAAMAPAAPEATPTAAGAAKVPVAAPAAPPTPARAPATPRPVAAARRAPVRPARRTGPGVPRWLWPAALGLAAVVVLAVAGTFAWRALAGRVRLDAVSPTRVRVGQRATLTGSGFSPDPAGNVVSFDDQAARIVSASPTRLEVEVPAVGDAGSERPALVVARVGARESKPVSVAVIEGPRLHGISPAAAMPGEEVVLLGAGWGVGATVRFGTLSVQPAAVEPGRMRVVVPEIPGGPGTSAPVAVIVGGVESNAAPFAIGRLPVLTGVNPPAASPGELVEVSGLGFAARPEANDVRIAGAPALVVSAAGDLLKVVVPWLGPGDPARALELRVQGNANVGQGVLQVNAPPETIEARFVPEPFAPSPDRRHAVVSTGIGPAFVLAAAGGRSAAERAVEAASRLNAAVGSLRTTIGLNFEARSLDAQPTIGLAGRPDAVLEITPEDAAAYNEDWTGLKGRGGPVTPARLARWWEAIARDLVLLTVRGERPRFAAALAPEGRVLGQLFDSAQKSGSPGVPRQLVADAKPPLRDGLRLAGLRVPATVGAPLGAPAAGTVPGAAATPVPPRLQLEGSYRGRETEEGQIRYLMVTFAAGGGSVTYEGGISFSVPLVSVEPRGRDQVRFSVRMRGGMRYYAGRWDGEKLTGPLSKDAAGREVVGSFELRR